MRHTVGLFNIPLLQKNPLAYKYLGLVSYKKALEIQDKIQALRKPQSILSSTDELERKVDLTFDTDLLLLLQHPPTYTEGRRHKILDPIKESQLRALGAEYFNSLRGGQTTFHGPGQLVGYPIINLKNNKISVKCYVSYLEKFLIDVCAHYGISAGTTNDTGVWVGDNKIAALGVLVRQYITTHGFSLNCTTDLSWFDHIVPCGLVDKGVTSLLQELKSDRQIHVDDVIPIVTQLFAKQFDFSPPKLLSVANPKLDSLIGIWLAEP
ncbi:hypothetical protein DSO57_1001316 [Entomophthora muscae]|uniref:Uncharacterized protein n=1 Tax=Entomophthora muscae TaxID=34485 RepID=A0ACC2U8P4_9FUNG|nr:hypothetical protein DSO57_1001316 [Entomophthora muscae]